MGERLRHIRTPLVVVDQDQQFEAMYREHSGAVRAFVHRRVATNEADDLVGDVFAAAWRRIARGLIANQRRGAERRRALQARLQAAATPDLEVGAEHHVANTDAVLSALASLRDADRELLQLVAWDGLDRAEAATVLGVSSSVFSLRLHRARRRLAKALSTNESDQTRPLGSSPMEAAHER
jgi:DNA-directed RNA polymerase specialized sigma24 family protein